MWCEKFRALVDADTMAKVDGRTNMKLYDATYILRMKYNTDSHSVSLTSQSSDELECALRKK